MTVPYKASEKWDVHTHSTLSPDTYEALARFSHYNDFVRVRQQQSQPCCADLVNSKGEKLRTIQENAYRGSARIHDCDRYGVTMQVISPTPMMIPDFVDHAEDAHEICRIINDANASLVASHPTRFTALAAIPMGFADQAIAEMERAKNQLGMRGIEINSNVNGKDLDNKAFFPIFEAAADLNLAVFIHPWGGCMTHRRMVPNWRAWLIGMPTETALAFDAMRSGRVHQRLPQLRVLYAHGGGAFPYLLGRMEHGAYCRPDLFSSPQALDPYRVLREAAIYTDSLVHNPWALQTLIQILGIDRVAMGSDYPYPLGEADPIGRKGISPGHLVESLPGSKEEMQAAKKLFPWLPQEEDLPQLTDSQKDAILFQNAKAWLYGGYT